MSTHDTAEQAYNEQFDAFMAIPQEQVVRCTVPLDVVAAEGSQLVVVAVEDRDKLLGAGLHPSVLESLPVRVEALIFAAARYQMAEGSDPAAVRAWKAESPKGYALRAYLIRVFEFAYREEPEVLSSVRKIKSGRGHQDMVLDLLSLSILGKDHPEPLSQIPMFDPATLEEARALHETLNELLARAATDPKAVNQARDILHRAYTHYKQAADEVIAHGRFVFEGTDRYLAYVSDYRRSLGKQSTKSTEDTESENTELDTAALPISTVAQ